jgi:FkbM family methyltransferase
LQAAFLVVACALGVVVSRRLEFFPIALLLLVLLIWILARKTKKLSKLVVASPSPHSAEGPSPGSAGRLVGDVQASPLPHSVEGPSPGSAGRLVGDVHSFLEDIKARGFVPRGILDVGANRGDWTKMALEVFPSAQSILVEPQEEMAPYLQSLCVADPRCQFFKCGAGKAEGELVLTLWEDTYGSSYTVPKDEKLMKDGKQRITPIRTIDGILREVGSTFFPDLVKVDVQGFELEVLSGGESLFGLTEVFILETTLLVVKDDPVWPSTRRVIEYMGKKGYEIYDLTSFLRKPSDGALGQLDFAFVKAEGKFRQNFTW